MEKENNEPFPYQLMACNYCEHLYEEDVGTCYCLNRESPYHYFRGKKWSPKVEASLTKKALTSEQMKKGCEMIKFEGNPIPEEIFRKIPNDSVLRTLGDKIISN